MSSLFLKKTSSLNLWHTLLSCSFQQIFIVCNTLLLLNSNTLVAQEFLEKTEVVTEHGSQTSALASTEQGLRNVNNNQEVAETQRSNPNFVPDDEYLIKTSDSLTGLGTDTSIAQALVEKREDTTDSILETLQSAELESNSGEDALNQVTNVSQLRDVSPGDWAYEALRSLVERYGCIAGYPDGTYRGNRAMTRYEFAAGVNSCLQQIERLIGTSTESFVTQQDLETLQRLVDEFRTEITALGTRVDQLEGRVAFLEDHQFSTTTKLNGEAIFAIADVFGNEKPGGSDLEVNTILANRTRLNFDTTFTGKDRLRVRLQARNITPFNTATDTNMTRLSFDGNNDNNVEIDDLYYQFPLTKQTLVSLIANAYGSENLANPLNPLLQSDATGSISRFGRFHSIYRLAEGTGIGITQKFGDALSLSLAYRATNGSNPNEKAGLFDGQSGAMAQLTFQPSPALSVGLTYVNYYAPGNNVNTTGSIGSAFASRPFNRVATLAQAYGLETSWRISPKFTVSGWAGYTYAQALSGPNQGSHADIWNWAVTLGFPDLGKKGSLFGVVVGMPPKVTDNTFSSRENRNTSYHIEAFYRYRLTTNIDITPGFFVILNPEHDHRNDALWVGTLRTTFRF